jgi:acrylyl-CoA reductase (NADPH)
MFRALQLSQSAQTFGAAVVQLDEASLPPGDVQARVEYSTLNFKDGLAICNKSPVVRLWPMVAGIDGAGVVLSSSHPDWQAGDRFIHNGWGLGETRWGLLAERASLQGQWLVRLPASMSARQAMAIGTAGYTAMLCVMALQKHGVTPDKGDILVTGAGGGVGSVAIALLAKLGYRVVASTGRPQEADYLRQLGAADVMDRAELSAPGKPLAKERWAGVVDTVGSHTLANACASTKYGGVVTACGLAQGMDFPSSVAPFILRGVTLAGIDSVMAPRAVREAAWARMAQDLDTAQLERMTREVGLADAIGLGAEILAGQVRGRVVVNVNR